MSSSFLTLKEFSEKYSWLSVATLRRMVRDGQIDYLQPRGKGGTIMIPDNALDDLIVRASSDVVVGIDVGGDEGGVKHQTRRRSGRLPKWKR